MTVLAALLTGVATAAVLAAATGTLPAPRRPGRRRGPSAGQVWLQQAGSDLPLRRFVLGSAAAGAATFAVVVALTAAPAVALVPAVGVAWLPRAAFARRRARRLRDLERAWPDGLRDLVAASSAGLSLHQGLEGLAASGPPALRSAFARYPSLARVLGVVAALEALREELADPTTDRVIEVLILAHDRGGTLVLDILRSMAEATTRDVETAEQVRSESLEQRINARAVFVLPWLILVLLTAQEGYFRDFYRSPGGLTVVLVGAAMSAFGIAIVGRLGRAAVEPRVLVGAGPPPPAAGVGAPLDAGTGGRRGATTGQVLP